MKMEALAKGRFHETRNAETRDEADKAFKSFVEASGVKFDKAVRGMFAHGAPANRKAKKA